MWKLTIVIAGSDSANFLPVPTSHGVGISGAGLRVSVMPLAHRTIK